MQQLTILNTRDVKRIRDLLVRQFGVSLQKDYAYLLNEKNKIYLLSKDAARLDWKKLVLDRLGLYFGEDKGSEIRLSKEGAQLLAQEAGKKKIKNMVALDQKEVKGYFQGQDIEKDLGAEGRMILLNYDGNTLGCAKYKEGKILNFLPKMYRGEVIL